MASKLKQLSSKACQATQFVTKHGNVYYKQLMEQNKQYVQDPPTVEKCNLLAKQLLYTRLASIPGRTEAFWKELDYVKNLWKNRQELKVEDAGIAALFGLECFAWFCAGEIVGRGFTFTGATGDFVVDVAQYWLEFLYHLPYRKRNDYITKRPEGRTVPWPKNL